MKYSLLILFTIFFSIQVFAQVEIAETRKAKLMSDYNYNFKKVSMTQSHIFKITNINETILKIVDVDLPDQVSVFISSKIIKKGDEALVIITVDPTVTNKGRFKRKIILHTEQTEPNVITRKEIQLVVTGEVE